MTNEIAHSVAKNTTVLLGSQAVTWASSFILMLFLPRYLGSEEYGRLYLALSFAMIAQMIIDFGGAYFLPKEIARFPEKASELVVNSLGARFVVWAVVLGLLLLFGMVVHYSLKVQLLLLILGSASMWDGAGRALRSWFQGIERMEFVTFGAMADRTFVTLAGVGGLFLGAGAVTIALIMAGGMLLNFLICRYFGRRIMRTIAAFEWRRSLRVLLQGVPYLLWSVFAVIYYRVDAVMMSLLTPGSVVGWYGAAYRFFDVLMFLPSVFTVAVFPVMARLWKTQAGTLRRTTQKSVEFIITAGIMASIGTFFFAPDIIALFFGMAEYGPSVQLLRVFAVGLVLVYIDMVLGTAIMASDRQKQWTLVALAAIPVNVVLNYFLIPATQNAFGNGGIGAALATLQTEFFVLVAAVSILPSHVLSSLNPMLVLKSVCAGAITVLALPMMREIPLHWMLQAVLAVCLYCSALLLLRVPERAEVRFLRQFFTVRNLMKLLVPQKGN